MTQRRKLGRKLLSFLLALAMLVGLMPGMSLTAYAAPTEELLTTITATGKEQASYSTANVATVSFSYTANGSSSYTNNGTTATWGWWGYGWTATVTPADGYTITKCVFYDDKDRTATDSEAPFVVETTEEDKTPKVNGTPILANTSKGITKIEVYGYVTPATSYSVTITAGDNMTKTTGSGDAEQTGLSGAMTDVVYTANEGYYFPENYSVTAVNGISVTRNSYTQITVSGTPSADVAIALTAPTAKTTPDAPTAAATDCTTADNNDGKLTGVTTAMEYKKSDEANWTAGTGSDITGLVPGTYYVRVKATDTTNASGNQELSIAGYTAPTYEVTYKVVNGTWSDDSTTDKKETVQSGSKPASVPTSMKAASGYTGGAWDTDPADATITGATTFTYTFTALPTYEVTYKVVNGTWLDDSTTDKTETVQSGSKPASVPTGMKAVSGYTGGTWDTDPANATITGATTFTYSFTAIPTYEVTYKVSNGTWSDDSTEDKSETVQSGAKPASVPTGMKAASGYTGGAWDTNPADATITGATTFTYTFTAKQAATVTKAPTAKTLTYTGQAQELVTAGTATGGTMQYALGTVTEATQPYTTSIPAKTNVGTYYVWYKVKGDNNHNDTDAACTAVTISPADNSELTTAINDAKTFYESIEKEYPAVAKELKTALDKAEAVAGSNTSTLENISDATEALDTALNLAKDKVEFEKYKTTKETEAGNLAKTDDSDASKALITKAQQDIASATYNTEKTLGENKAEVNTIITDLKSALDTQRAVDKEAADKATADKVIEAINTLPAKEDVTASDKEVVEAAREAYDALTASQKDKIDTATLQKLTDAEEALVALGELDKNVVAFNSEKNVQKAEAVKLAKEDDSDAVRKLIADAREAIDALAYDKNKSLDENKAVLAAIVTELGNALEEQRELEKILAVVKIDQGETVAEVDETAIRAEDVETVTNVAKSTDADLSEAATTCVKQIVEESETVEDSDKNIVIVPALDVKGKEYSVTETDATMTLDIEAVYTSYETTSDITTAADVKSATEAEEETEKAKVKAIGSGKLDTEGTPVNVKIEVPAAFAVVLGATTETVKASPATIYVKHTHKNKNYEYNASLYCEGNRYFVEFVNPNGFSPFTLSGNSASVASIGDKNYTDLQSAIDDAADGSTIKLTNDNDVSATINTEKTITIDKDSHTGNVDIKAADTLLLTKTDNKNGTTTYKTVTKYTVTFDNNGGKGTMPAQEIGGTAALNVNAFTKEGYTFDGWNTKSDGSGTAYADKADVTPSADMTLYAQWKENPNPDDKDKTDAEVEAVKTKINALKAADKITTADKAAIEAADKAYDALSEARKKLIDVATLKKLTDAKAALKAAEKAESDKAAADAVKTRINALKAADKITTTDKAAVEEARKAYDALSADQKKLVDAATLKKLTDAEKAFTTAEANDKAARELAAAKQEAQAAMNEQITVTQKGNKFTVKWKKASSADGYYVYASYCGKKATKPVKTVKKNTTTKVTISKINGKKISTKKNFHVYVVPYKIIDGKKVALGKSTVAHLVGAKSTKYSNVKKLTLTKKKYTVKVGKTAKIKAKVTLVNNNKKHIPKSHGAKFRYKSSDTSIATVDKNGKVKGIRKGTCTIYVYSINGLMKKAKVTVK